MTPIYAFDPGHQAAETASVTYMCQIELGSSKALHSM